MSEDEPSRLRVLLVEDEGGVALLIEDMLEELGCEVAASAARLSRAFEAAQSTAFDLAVLDVNVGGEASFELARALGDRGIPVLFSTGYGAGGMPAEFQGRPTLTKPFKMTDLRQAMADALGSESCRLDLNRESWRSSPGRSHRSTRLRTIAVTVKGGERELFAAHLVEAA